jgi:YggT family protein
MNAGAVTGYFLYFVYIMVNILTYAIIIRALMSWFNPSPENPIVRFVVEITDPILVPLSRVVPRIGMIDITPIVAIVLLNAIQWMLESSLRT